MRMVGRTYTGRRAVSDLLFEAPEQAAAARIRGRPSAPSHLEHAHFAGGVHVRRLDLQDPLTVAQGLALLACLLVELGSVPEGLHILWFTLDRWIEQRQGLLRVTARLHEQPCIEADV